MERNKIMMGRIGFSILFLILNFGALGIGTILMDSGPTSDWYIGLNKAPWTPPGWVFGAAWTSIMLLFSFYMSTLIKLEKVKSIWFLFALQWVLNVSWNWVFFNQHHMILGQVILILLTITVGVFLIGFVKIMKYQSLFIVPYFLWLLVANSLNLFTILNN